jgi:hypothetical protein
VHETALTIAVIPFPPRFEVAVGNAVHLQENSQIVQSRRFLIP